jgi:hypothetical protein
LFWQFKKSSIIVLFLSPFNDNRSIIIVKIYNNRAERISKALTRKMTDSIAVTKEEAGPQRCGELILFDRK